MALTTMQRSCIFVLVVVVAAFLLTFLFSTCHVARESHPHKPDRKLHPFRVTTPDKDVVAPEPEECVALPRRVPTHTCDTLGENRGCATCRMILGTK